LVTDFVGHSALSDLNRFIGKQLIKTQEISICFDLQRRSDPQRLANGSNTWRERGGVTQSRHLSLIYRGDVDEVPDSRSLLAPMSLWLLSRIIFLFAHGCSRSIFWKRRSQTSVTRKLGAYQMRNGKAHTKVEKVIRHAQPANASRKMWWSRG
jgi:hypothetical protein